VAIVVQPGSSTGTIVPNVNVSNRALARPITTAIFGETIVVDAAKNPAFPGDPQLFPISLVRQANQTDGELAVLAVTSPHHVLFDAQGRRIDATFSVGDVAHYAFSMEGKQAVNLLMQVDRPAGSPLVEGGNVLIGMTLLALHPVFFPQLRDPNHGFSVDTASLLVSPIHFPSNVDPVEALFICELEDNAPTVREVEAALTAIGAKNRLRIVPEDVSRGDAWLQDQFQAGICHDSRGRSLQVVVHLPRLRRETSAIDAPNLARFVEQYFPSRDVGLVDDFWHRTIEATTLDRGVVRIDFRDSMAVSMAFRLVDFFWEWSLEVRRAIRPALDPLDAPPAMSTRIHAAGLLLAHIIQELARSSLSGSDKTKLQARVEVLAEMLRGIIARFPLATASQIRCRIHKRTGAPLLDATLAADALDKLHEKLSSLQDSVNYGGNVEIIPSRRGDPRRIVVGHTSDRPMDPELRRFLGLQASGTELVDIDTAWLKVGHVDELLTFVPYSSSAKGWACLRNSAELGATLLLEAARFHLGDPSLSFDGTDWKSVNPDVFMGNATKPKFVSQLLRGQSWEYRFDRAASPFPQMHPPKIYDALRGSFPLDKPFWELEAVVSVDELLEIERKSQVQREVEKQKLEPLAAQLTRELGVPILPIPALFDLPAGAGMETLLPNMVNMQVLGRTVLVPRPFGPRMHASDAVTVVRAALGSHPAAAKASVALIRTLGLDQPILNVRHHPSSDYDTPDVASVANTFPDTAPDAKDAFLRRNRTAFDANGKLKAGWQRLFVPERTVDIFELTTAAVLAAGGVNARFVDTWYYHIRHGGLHCGTNTLRRPT
jgi:hypothetical protein